MFGGDWCEPPSEVFIRMAVTTLWCWTLDARYDAVGLCGTCYNQTEQEWQEIKGRNKHCLFELVHPTEKVCVLETKDGIDNDGTIGFYHMFFKPFQHLGMFWWNICLDLIWCDILGLYRKFPIRDLPEFFTIGSRRLHGKKWQKPSQLFLGQFLYCLFWLCVCVCVFLDVFFRVCLRVCLF